MGRNKKKKVLLQVFLKSKKKSTDDRFIVFSNNMVRDVARNIDFKNYFDVVKHDSARTLPEKIADQGYFIVHLGRNENGITEHAFVRGGDCGFNGFHLFENIPQKDRISWPLKGTLMERISNSEAQTISTAHSEQIFSHFLFEDKDAHIIMHPGRRARVSFEGGICPGIDFKARSVQLEVDAFFEYRRNQINPPMLATVEAKKTNAREFEVRQLYTAMMYLRTNIRKGKLPKDTEIRNLFVVRDSPRKGTNENWYHIRIYDYEFTDPDLMSSIKLRKASEYQLET